MRVKNCVLVAAAVLLLAGGTALAVGPTDFETVDFVYVTYPNAGGVYEWGTTVGDSAAVAW